MTDGDEVNFGRVKTDPYDAIGRYWDSKPFEYEVSAQPQGTMGYFEDVEAYYANKYYYLEKYIDYGSMSGKRILDIGCGMGSELVRLARAGASVTGVDLSDSAVERAKENLRLRNLEGEVVMANGEALEFQDGSFDCVFAISTLSYTKNPDDMVGEIYRLLRKDGTAYMTAYNANSWLNMLLTLFYKENPRQDSPFLHQFTVERFRRLFSLFSRVTVTTDRFPVRRYNDKSPEILIFNNLVVPALWLIPERVVKPYGHHHLAIARK